MIILVDTPVWSLFFRRRRGQLNAGQEALRSELAELIEEGRAQLIGPVRQEVLSGIREQTQFQLLRERLRAFVDPVVELEDYEEAARGSNVCRAKGIATSAPDMLLCAMAIRREWHVLTTDGDFRHYAKVLPVRLYEAR